VVWVILEIWLGLSSTLLRNEKSFSTPVLPIVIPVAGYNYPFSLLMLNMLVLISAADKDLCTVAIFRF
jgi:hypothetical protein